MVDRLIAGRPEDGTLRLRRARMHRRLGDPNRARDDEVRAIALGPPNRVRDMRAHHGQDAAAAAEAEGRWADALPSLTRLIETIDANSSVSLRRAEAHAHLANWPAAAADLDVALSLSPPSFAGLGPYFLRRLRAGAWSADRADPERLVLYRLGAGDLDAYRAICTTLRRLLARDADPGLALYLVYLESRGPGGSADPADSVRRAERAIAGLSAARCWRRGGSCGAALVPRRAVRRGRRAVRDERAAGGSGGRPWDWAFLSMAHHRLGHEPQAREYLNRLRAARPAAGPLRHRDRLELDVFRREADAVVRLDPVFPASPFAGD